MTALSEALRNLSTEDHVAQMYLARAAAEIDRLTVALAHSVKLQSHYASLLNMHDGGERMCFESADDWLRRLELLSVTKAPAP